MSPKSAKPTSARASLANPKLPFATPADWNAWLAKHHASSPGLWLKLAKKSTGVPSVTYAEALEVALIWGWIDGQKRSHDGAWWLQRFTPRGPRSGWSKINREKAQALIAAARMQPSGLAEVTRAKADGRWDAAYDSQSKAQVPDDLATALRARPKTEAFFAQLDSANRYAVLYRVLTAKKPETRAQRIERLVAMLARGETLHPPRTKR